MTDQILSVAAPPGVLPQPAISWSAVWAGAVVALASSLLLTLAAAGVGYDTGLPGIATRASLKAFDPMVGAVAIVVQVLSAALGGYVAGRTRTVWTNLHDDESHFRDTAHGLIVWAVATLAGVLLAATVLAPYADALAAAAPQPAVVPTAAEAQRAAGIAAQASLFLAIGMLLSAFVAAVGARIGGLRHEEMHLELRS
ncbi:MAG TPA: hypothetical protein VIJ94_11000 [Caulobacteraceae bacterium]